MIVLRGDGDGANRAESKVFTIVDTVIQLQFIQFFTDLFCHVAEVLCDKTPA